MLTRQSLNRSGQLILIFLALGGLTHCGGSIVKEKEVVDTVNPSIKITDPADGATLDTTTVVVSGTVSDPEPSSGIDYVVVNGKVASGTTNWANWTVTIAGLTQGGPNTLEATALDEAGNTGTDKVGVDIF